MGIHSRCLRREHIIQPFPISLRILIYKIGLSLLHKYILVKSEDYSDLISLNTFAHFGKCNVVNDIDKALFNIVLKEQQMSVGWLVHVVVWDILSL